MPLQRIRATPAGQPTGLPSALRAQGLRLAPGRTLLNRRADGTAALIVVSGRLLVGVPDDDACLQPGEGVLLPDGTVYSLRTEEDVVAVLFKLSAEGGRRTASPRRKSGRSVH